MKLGQWSKHCPPSHLCLPMATLGQHCPGQPKQNFLISRFQISVIVKYCSSYWRNRSFVSKKKSKKIQVCFRF